MLKFLYGIIFIGLSISLSWAQETTPIGSSGLTGAKLPANALRLAGQAVFRFGFIIFPNKFLKIRL